MDFYDIKVEYGRRGEAYIIVDFKNEGFKDLMIKGSSFYAVWDGDNKRWSTNPLDVVRLVDEDQDRYLAKHKQDLPPNTIIKYLRNNSSKKWKEFIDYTKNIPDTYHQLDTDVHFKGDVFARNDYASKTLPYELIDTPSPCYDEMMSVLYSDEERQKIEWMIGSVIAGDSKKNQKFFVLYGGPGTGKSTVLDIVSGLFEGYCGTFDAKALASNGNSFATELLKNNPLIAMQHDGDLSRIEDNTKLNSIISHEVIPMNEKHKSQYTMRPNCILLMATNTPVKITDDKSGIKRRLVDINPTGNVIQPKRFDYLKNQILEHELSGIAFHCYETYTKLGKDYYKHYEPRDMQYMTDYFFNFVEENYHLFKNQNYTFINQAYDLYLSYVQSAGLPYKITKQEVRYKLMDYFDTYAEERQIIFNGERKHIRSYYEGFRTDKFDRTVVTPSLKEVKTHKKTWLDFKEQHSILDDYLAEYPAQYATSRETPSCKWSECKTLLKGITTDKLHYVKCPINLIVIDFDLKDAVGNKSFELNYEAALKWPKTYAELSKSGAGIHLHYIYDGDPEVLERLYSKDIEVKVFPGDSSLRRLVTKCNDSEIAHLEEGKLAIREKKDYDMVDKKVMMDEASLQERIIRTMNKEYHAGTKPAVDFIYKLLDDAYNSGMPYDLHALYPDVEAFALSSTHHAEYCSKLVTKMHFQSDEPSTPVDSDYNRIVFYDIEVFPNLLLVNWKFQGKENPVIRMINPSPEEIRELMKYDLVGFNCRRYDNHIIYARAMGYNNAQLYEISQRIINKSENGFFREAYEVSYTDIYDFITEKMSLKKWEIKLHIHHHELGMAWDQPVPEDKWDLVAEYCDDDVLATEAVWDANQESFLARKILADVAGMNVNTTTNTLTTRIIFGKDKTPQKQFSYRNLAEPINVLSDEAYEFLCDKFPEMMAEEFVGDEGERSLLPFFKGYKFEHGKSTYRGIEVGEGGEVWAKPGMYYNVWTFDVASMHPHSAMTEYLFGEYTKVFWELVQARVYIKHKDFESAGKLFNGKLKKYLDDPGKAKALAGALKIAINSVYGLTAASFENAFRDPRNKDNIVAKRGALFMIDLLYKVQEMGGEVIHIKTDSIKVVNPSEEIKNFIFKYGKRHGYTFEIEHIFEKICLVNNAVYIAKLSEEDAEWQDAKADAIKKGKPIPTRWTATGTQFAVPYVFKKLFSHEEIEFDDLCETKQVTGSIYIDMNEGLMDVSDYEKELSDRGSKTLKLKPQDDYFYRNPQMQCVTDEELEHLIAQGHSYRFVGKIGLFTPIKRGCGGGVLYSSKEEGKYSAVTGTKGYRWMESELVESLGKQGDVDLSYYEELCKDAIESISQFGNFEAFAA